MMEASLSTPRPHWLRRPWRPWLLALLLPLAGRVQAQAPAWQAAFAPTIVSAGSTSVVRGTAVNAAGDVFVTGNFYNW